MRIVPIPPGGITDQKLLKFFTDVVKALKSIPDIQCYSATAVWAVPFDLYIPMQTTPTPRQGQPDIVRLGRATLAADPTTVVSAPNGGTTWQWRGNDIVRILDQPGLVEGVRYNLVFEVVDQ